ncbi:hypothetical protein [Streptomyces sp. NPDC059003]|uniref:hypothetical protein n=1 Tax=Streptomyces sp. NPDC059003 TaxID=3346691 RepID=UPI0036A2B843
MSDYGRPDCVDKVTLPIVGYGGTNGDGYTHVLTGRRTLCGTLASDSRKGPADCPNCQSELENESDEDVA